MGTQGYRETYRAAFEVAHTDLEEMLNDWQQLELRQKQLQTALGALEPFLRSAKPVPVATRLPEPARVEPVRHEPAPKVAQTEVRASQAPKPLVTAAFSPVAQTSLDPIQDRIDRALGLAAA